MKISKNKYIKLEKMSNEFGIIGALAIDQRGSIKNDRKLQRKCY